MFTRERVDLHLPTSWNAATTAELEVVARCFRHEAERAARGKAYDVAAAKVEAFFLLTELEVVAPANPVVPVEDQYYLVRRTPKHKGLLRWLRDRDNEPFALYLYQIEQWTREELKWLDGTSRLTLFPYTHVWRRLRRFQGPQPLMADFTWTQFRMAGDAMTYYVQQANRLEHMRRQQAAGRGSDVASLMPSHEMRKQMRQVSKAKGLFLATIFSQRRKFVDSETKRLRRDWRYVSNQSTDNAELFRNVSDVRWQVVLWWWEGMMQYLAAKYSKVYKKGGTEKSSGNVLDVYTRTVATMEKYLGMDDEQIGRQPYTVVLQHLNDMIEQSEEIERASRK